MGAIASQIITLTIVYSAVYWGADQRKHQSFASLAFERGIHRWSVNSPHKWPVTRKIFPFDDVIMPHFERLHLYRGQMGSVHIGYPRSGYIARCIANHCVKSQQPSHHPCGVSPSVPKIWVSTLKPEHNGRHLADDVCKCIFENEIYCILIHFHWGLVLGVQMAIRKYWTRQ